MRLESWRLFEIGLDDKHTFLSSVAKVGIGSESERQEWKAEVAQVTLVSLPEKASLPSLGAIFKSVNRKRDGSLFVKQLFWRYRFNDLTSLKVGRFEFHDGEERLPENQMIRWLRLDQVRGRLVGTYDFSQIGRSFDGFQISVDRRKDSFTFALLRPTKGVFDLKANDELTNVLVAYSSWVLNPDNQTDIRLFALLLL